MSSQSRFEGRAVGAMLFGRIRLSQSERQDGPISSAMSKGGATLTRYELLCGKYSSVLVAGDRVRNDGPARLTQQIWAAGRVRADDGYLMSLQGVVVEATHLRYRLFSGSNLSTAFGCGPQRCFKLNCRFSGQVSCAGL